MLDATRNHGHRRPTSAAIPPAPGRSPPHSPLVARAIWRMPRIGPVSGRSNEGSKDGDCGKHTLLSFAARQPLNRKKRGAFGPSGKLHIAALPSAPRIRRHCYLDGRSTLRCAPDPQRTRRSQLQCPMARDFPGNRRPHTPPVRASLRYIAVFERLLVQEGLGVHSLAPDENSLLCKMNSSENAVKTII